MYLIDDFIIGWKIMLGILSKEDPTQKQLDEMAADAEVEQDREDLAVAKGAKSAMDFEYGSGQDALKDCPSKDIPTDLGGS